MLTACISNFMATNAAPEPPETGPKAASANAAGALVPFAGRPARKLSEELECIIEDREVTLREVIVVLQGRAYNLLMLLLALPFLLPVPLPGLSTALGLVIALIAARLTLGQKPWLPARLLDKKLPEKFFPTVFGSARRFLRFLEVMLRPRLLWLTSPLLVQMHSFIIFLAAAVLLLPLPPGTNFPPAACIVIMAVGLLERDGLFVLAGYVAFALNGVFFTYFGSYVFKLAQSFLHWITG